MATTLSWPSRPDLEDHGRLLARDGPPLPPLLDLPLHLSDVPGVRKVGHVERERAGAAPTSPTRRRAGGAAGAGARRAPAWAVEGGAGVGAALARDRQLLVAGTRQRGRAGRQRCGRAAPPESRCAGGRATAARAAAASRAARGAAAHVRRRASVPAGGSSTRGGHRARPRGADGRTLGRVARRRASVRCRSSMRAARITRQEPRCSIAPTPPRAAAGGRSRPQGQGRSGGLVRAERRSERRRGLSAPEPARSPCRVARCPARRTRSIVSTTAP